MKGESGLKNLWKFLIPIFLLTPGSFVVPAAFVLGVVHHVTAKKDVSAEKDSGMMNFRDNWTRKLRDRLGSPTPVSSKMHTPQQSTQNHPHKQNLFAKLKLKKFREKIYR